VVRSCPSPVGRAHPIRSTWGNFLRARRTGFSHRVGASCPTWLRPFALPHPDALSPLSHASARPWPIGAGICRLSRWPELRLNGVLGSTQLPSITKQ
jgi:hypothetical protein